MCGTAEGAITEPLALSSLTTRTILMVKGMGDDLVFSLCGCVKPSADHSESRGRVRVYKYVYRGTWRVCGWHDVEGCFGNVEC